jgi:oligoribonuclease (3'-5' exoribonuclease)
VVHYVFHRGESNEGFGEGISGSDRVPQQGDAPLAHDANAKDRVNTSTRSMSVVKNNVKYRFAIDMSSLKELSKIWINSIYE